jgi:hypothetical protein
MTSLEGWGSTIELRPRAGSRDPDPPSVAYRVAATGRTFAASQPAGRTKKSSQHSTRSPQRRQDLTSAQHRPEQVALLRHPLQHGPDREAIWP